MRKINKKKLYGIMTNGGVGLSMFGMGTFLTSYVSSNHISPAIAISSIGVITLGGLSSLYGSIKQSYNYDIKEENEENEDIYENIYDLDVIELKRKNLRLVETRFEYDKNSMSTAERNVIRYNIAKEKLLIKKVLEGYDTDLQSVEQECDLIVSLILDSDFDEEYLDYKEEVLTSKIIDFPKYESDSIGNKKDGKVLKFPKKQ